MPEGLCPHALIRGILDDSAVYSFGQCKTFTIKTKQSPEQPEPPTSPSPRGAPHTWRCGSRAGPELEDLLSGTCSGIWGRSPRAPAALLPAPTSGPEPAGPGGRGGSRTLQRPTRCGRLGHSRTPSDSHLPARSAPARVPSNRQPIAAGPRPFYGSRPRPHALPRGGEEVCDEREPIRAAASRPAPSHWPRARRRAATVRWGRAVVRHAGGRVLCLRCPLRRVSLGSEKRRRGHSGRPGVRHGHGGRAGAEGGGLCPEQGLPGLPHEVTSPRGRSRRGLRGAEPTPPGRGAARVRAAGWAPRSGAGIPGRRGGGLRTEGLGLPAARRESR